MPLEIERLVVGHHRRLDGPVGASTVTDQATVGLHDELGEQPRIVSGVHPVAGTQHDPDLGDGGHEIGHVVGSGDRPYRVGAGRFGTPGVDHGPVEVRAVHALRGQVQPRRPGPSADLDPTDQGAARGSGQPRRRPIVGGQRPQLQIGRIGPVRDPALLVPRPYGPAVAAENRQCSLGVYVGADLAAHPAAGPDGGRTAGEVSRITRIRGRVDDPDLVPALALTRAQQRHHPGQPGTRRRRDADHS